MSEDEKNTKPGIGGLLEGLNNFVEIVMKLNETGEILREGEFKGGKDNQVSGVYGLRIKAAGSGNNSSPGSSSHKGPSVEHFGNIKKSAAGPLVAEEREPLVDVFDEQDTVTIIAEIPGATEETITISIDGPVAYLKAQARDRKYYKEIALPAAVENMPKEKSYANGIFSSVFSKQKS